MEWLEDWHVVSVYSYKCGLWGWVCANVAREKDNKIGRKACVLQGLPFCHFLKSEVKICVYTK